MKEKRERKQPNYLYDVLEAVDMMDAKKRLKEDFSKEHARAVKAVQLANTSMYPGYISISKARTLLQQRYRQEKGKSEKTIEKQKVKG